MSQLNIVTSKSRTLQPNAVVSGAVLSGGALQITCVHSLQVGDIVSISGIVGAVEANVVGIVSSISTTVSFKLENTPGAVTSYISGGTVKHIGFAGAAVSIDNAVFDGSVDFTLKARLESLSANSSARILVEDGVGTIAEFNAAGATNFKADETWTRRSYDLVDARIGNSANTLRAKVLFPAAVPGASAQLSVWVDLA